MDPAKLKKAIEAAQKWILESGIQNLDSKNREYFGSFSAWYNYRDDSYPFVYTEITAYVITALLYLYTLNRDKLLLERACLAGDWLLRRRSPKEIVECLLPLSRKIYDYKARRAYTFDNGIVINSLVNLYRATKQEKYLQAAESICHWLIDHLQAGDGGFLFAYDLEKNLPLEDNEKHSWSTTKGSYHSKIAIGMLNLFNITKNEKIATSVKRLLSHCACCQSEEGGFYSYIMQKSVHFHPHLYSIEGFLCSGVYLKNLRYLEIVKKGMFWSFGFQTKDGQIPRFYRNGQPVYKERVDILAQSVRLGIICLHLGILPLTYRKKIKIGLRRLLLNQETGTNLKSAGGFHFGYGHYDRRATHINPWVTCFALQAISYYKQYEENKLNFRPFCLI